MVAYLSKVKSELSEFEFSSVEQVPREQKSNVDALVGLGTTKEADTLNVVMVEFSESPSIIEKPVEVGMIVVKPTWMTPIVEYLITEKLPDDRKDVRKFLYQVL
ncbi:uncharacterized protein LOC133795937 [Humulus lupulus]|uniref:uncharacterized protein LOC133795937 n=1 Tax=Humulus lupulus TaxID=3486 RepID=UPI002B40E98A|nr:uncharacterized protein LOC133795937 [Humulus lupulus]